MKREEILAMEPGYYLDALIAEKIMGWTKFGVREDGSHFGWNAPYGYSSTTMGYSQIISLAWEVVRKLREDNWWIVLNSEGEKWSALFYWDPHKQAYECEADEAPEAICKAALLAVLEEGETT